MKSQKFKGRVYLGNDKQLRPVQEESKWGYSGWDEGDRSSGDLGATGKGMGFILPEVHSRDRSWVKLVLSLETKWPANRQSRRVEAGSWSPMGHTVFAEGPDTRTEYSTRLHSKAS